MIIKKKVLIVDDSALMRRVMSDIINKDSRIQVADIVKNGMEAWEILSKENEYDCILLDINMPKMNGIEFLEKIQNKGVKAKILICSTIAKTGGYETIRALELGAFDFVRKPDSLLETRSKSFSDILLEKLYVALGFMDLLKDKEILKEKQNYQKLPVKRLIPTENIEGTRIVALACSTGGPKALQQVIPLLPANLNAAVLVVQHMPEGFTNSLALRLNEMSEIKVKEAEDGERIEKGVVYIAKGGSQMRVQKKSKGVDYLAETKEPARFGLKPCADIMYESLIYSDYAEIVTVILTGMGSDGTRGVQQLKRQKIIYTIAQNEETCTVYGMPKVIAENGLVDEVLPLARIAEAIVKKTGVL